MAEVHTSATNRPLPPPMPTPPEAPLPAFQSPLPSLYQNVLQSLYQRLFCERRRRREAEEDRRELQEKLLCMICIERAKCVVFLPCAHMMACDACGPACVRVLSGYRCPAAGCNQVITHVVVGKGVGMVADEQIAPAGFR